MNTAIKTPKITVPKEIAELIREGEEFEQLVRLPAWAKLLDRLEQRVEKSLVAMRECRSSNPRIQSAFMDTWRRAQEWFDLVQQEVLMPIKMKKEAKNEIRSIMRQEMGEISEDQEREMEEKGELPRVDQVWDFDEEL